MAALCHTKYEESASAIKNYRPRFRGLHRKSSLKLFSVELVFANSAKRTYKILRNIFPSCSRCYPCFRIACFGIILPTAEITYIFSHNESKYIHNSLIFQVIYPFSSFQAYPGVKVTAALFQDYHSAPVRDIIIDSVSS